MLALIPASVRLQRLHASFLTRLSGSWKHTESISMAMALLLHCMAPRTVLQVSANESGILFSKKQDKYIKFLSRVTFFADVRLQLFELWWRRRLLAARSLSSDAFFLAALLSAIWIADERHNVFPCSASCPVMNAISAAFRGKSLDYQKCLSQIKSTSDVA